MTAAILPFVHPRRCACAQCGKFMLRNGPEDGEPRFCGYRHAVYWHKENRPAHVGAAQITGNIYK